jgi:hypothetical protein
MREIHHTQDAKDHCETDGEQCVDATDTEAVYYLLNKEQHCVLAVRLSAGLFDQFPDYLWRPRWWGGFTQADYVVELQYSRHSARSDERTILARRAATGLAISLRGRQRESI